MYYRGPRPCTDLCTVLAVSLGLSVLSLTFCKADETAGPSPQGQEGGKPHQSGEQPREIFGFGFYSL